jgi:2-dehydro-3-deoxygluconokinase
MKVDDVDDAPAGAATIVTFGETMALFTSERPGPLAHAGRLTLGVAGSESNVAIGLARLGRSAVWLGRVGDDPLGQLVSREIRAEGVVTHAIVDTQRATGLMLKERRTPSVQRVHYYRAGSAGSGLQPADVPATVVEGAAVLHATGITPALSDSARQTVRTAIDIAIDAGVTVSFDLNFRSKLWRVEAASGFYREVIPLADLLFANPSEAATVCGELDSPADYARALVDRGAGVAIMKLGEDGALAYDGDTFVRQEAFRVPVVDTVGAGDAFVAGYLAAFVDGGRTQACLELGAAVGAVVCMSPGDWEGLPRWDELELLTRADPVAR